MKQNKSYLSSRLWSSWCDTLNDILAVQYFSQNLSENNKMNTKQVIFSRLPGNFSLLKILY